MARREQPAGDTLLWTMLILGLAGSASAIINNLLDQEIDTTMDRTGRRNRSIEIWGRSTLWMVSSLMLCFSLALAAIKLNWLVVALTFAAFFTYVIWYTLFLKRRSPFGVVLGGIPGALPILIGAYAVSNRFAADIWLLFLFMILWQPAHFWALALKIKNEYAAAKVPVLPVVFGDRYTKLYIYLYGASLLPVSLGIVYLGGYGKIYFVTAIAAGIYYLIETIRCVHYSERYRRAFLVSLLYMMLLMIGIIADVLL